MGYCSLLRGRALLKDMVPALGKGMVDMASAACTFAGVESVFEIQACPAPEIAAGDWAFATEEP